MKILVTGHCGYIGAVLVPRLLARGHDVLGMDSNLFVEDLLPGTTLARVPAFERDIREARASDFDGVDAVVHLAALSNDPLGNLNPELTRVINYTASLAVARLAKEAGVRRFVFSSSCSSYGAAGDDLLDETATFHPVTPYAVEKVRLEAALAELQSDDFTPVFLRNATVYGVSPLLRLDLVINNLVAWAVTTGKVRLLSDGTPWRPVVHVEDACLAIIAALEAPVSTVANEAFNIGRTEHNYRIRELAEIVASVVPGTSVEIAEGATADARTYRVDFSKAEQRLPGYAPTWDPARGAEQLAAAYQAAKFERGVLDGPRYIRLKRLEQLIADGRVSSDLRLRASTVVS